MNVMRFAPCSHFSNTLDGLNAAEVPNLDKAKLNVWEFRNEVVVGGLRNWKRAAGKKRAGGLSHLSRWHHEFAR